MRAQRVIRTRPDWWFFPLWKRQFAHQLEQMWEQANLLGYPRYDNLADFSLHIYEENPRLVNERLN